MSEEKNIVFEGYINGEAEKFFWKNTRKIEMKILLFTVLAMFAILGTIAMITGFWLLVTGWIAICVISYPLTLIPSSKKFKFDHTPKKIFTDIEYIVSISNTEEEYNLIEDVSKVTDYGEFYYISFPFGKVSCDFVCQKSLLTCGTLEEFESLFEGKIERKIESSNKIK